jgi:hypothetical protein
MFPLPEDFVMESHKTISHKLHTFTASFFKFMVYKLNFNSQSKIVGDNLSNYKFLFFDENGNEAIVGTLGYPAHIIRTQFFQRNHRLMMAHSLIQSIGIKIRSSKDTGYRTEGKKQRTHTKFSNSYKLFKIGIDFLITKNIYKDAFVTHDNMHGFKSGKHDPMKSQSDLTGGGTISLNALLRGKSKKITPEDDEKSDKALGERAFWMIFEEFRKGQEHIPLRGRLILQWVHGKFFSKNQKLEDMRKYFGEKVAFYYVFLEYYKSWLYVTALLGSIVFLYGIYKVTTYVRIAL